MMIARPHDLLPLADIGPDARIRSMDADLATVLPEADKVLEVTTGRDRYIVHLEFQTGRDPKLLQRLLSYNALLYRRHGRAVWTVLILLTPDADHADLDGNLHIKLPDGRQCQLVQLSGSSCLAIAADFDPGGINRPLALRTAVPGRRWRSAGGG